MHLGFASVPLSLEDQVKRTPDKTVANWFAIESAWTLEIGADISVGGLSLPVLSAFADSFASFDKLQGRRAEEAQTDHPCCERVCVHLNFAVSQSYLRGAETIA